MQLLQANAAQPAVQRQAARQLGLAVQQRPGDFALLLERVRAAYFPLFWDIWKCFGIGFVAGCYARYEIADMISIQHSGIACWLHHWKSAF